MAPKKNAPYGGKGEYDLAKEMMAKRAAKKKASYSPEPMSAAAKAKAKAAGAAAQSKTGKMSPAQKEKLKKMLSQGGNLDKDAKARARAKNGKAGSSTVSKVVGRAKTVAREVRDIPTAAANVIKSSRSFPKGGVAKFAKKDLKTQIKEVGTAIKSGKKGTEAATENYTSMKGRVGGGGLDYYISKPKKKRK